MKKLIVALVMSLLWMNAYAAETKTPAPPSEASIKELLNVMEARAMVDNMVGHVQGMMSHASQQALQGKTPSAEQQQAMDKMQAKVMGIIKEEMDWDGLVPMYIRVYQQTFTQAEIDGMIKFYRSPTGQAVVKKMPMAMQSTMTEMQKRVGPMSQKVQQAIQESVQEIQAAAKPASAESSSAPTPTPTPVK